MFVVEKMFSRTLTADGLVEVGGRCGSCGRVVGDKPDPPAADVGGDDGPGRVLGPGDVDAVEAPGDLPVGAAGGVLVLHGDGGVAGDGHVGVGGSVVADAAGAALSSNADGLGGYQIEVLTFFLLHGKSIFG